MSRILFVVPPLTGHINPTIAIAAALVARGHEVAWVGYRQPLERLLPTGSALFAIDPLPGAPGAVAAREAGDRLRGFARLRFLWDEVLAPLGARMLAPVEAALAAFQPTHLVTDQQAWAGWVVARRHPELRWTTLATTGVDRATSLSAQPKVHAWSEERLARFGAEHGLSALPPEPENSRQRVLVCSTPALAGAHTRSEPHYRYVGPVLPPPADPAALDALGPLPPRPRVLISLGSVNQRRPRFWATVQQAFAEAGIGVIAAAPEEAGPWPAHVLARPWLPQLALLPEVDAVVSHGGHNTVVEALAHGLPLALTPITDDQPAVAAQVVAAGAGCRLRFARLRPAALADACQRLLTDPALAAAADTIRRSFAEAGGAARAAALILGEDDTSETP